MARFPGLAIRVQYFSLSAAMTFTLVANVPMALPTITFDVY